MVIFRNICAIAGYGIGLALFHYFSLNYPYSYGTVLWYEFILQLEAMLYFNSFISLSLMLLNLCTHNFVNF